VLANRSDGFAEIRQAFFRGCSLAVTSAVLLDDGAELIAHVDILRLLILRRAKTPKVLVRRLNGEKNRLSLVTTEANSRRLGEKPFYCIRSLSFALSQSNY
jgi:hypothetical protein